MSYQVLTVSDEKNELIYSSHVRERFDHVDLVIGCGDLPYYYLEFIISMLDVPLYFVRGNHAKRVEHTSAGPRREPWGAVDLHKRVVEHDGLLLAGVEGCLRYNRGPFQYTQNEMWLNVLTLMPGLLANYLKRGRFLDIFVTHAPPWGIHDQSDRAHQGIKAFRWFDKVFAPAYHFHGHVHVYNPKTVTETTFGRTRIVNTFGYRETTIDVAPAAEARASAPKVPAGERRTSEDRPAANAG